MKGVKAFPIVRSEGADGNFVSIPDFGIETQGKDIADAIYMARDAIGLMGIDMQDDGKELPEPREKVEGDNPRAIITFVDVDFDEYRKKVDNKAVKKNCTIPYWLNVEAEKAGINYSKLLQEAIVLALNLNA